jgi:hypothetical protein
MGRLTQIGSSKDGRVWMWGSQREMEIRKAYIDVCRGTTALRPRGEAG